MERASKGEDIPRKGVEQNIRQIDKARARTRKILGGGKWIFVSNFVGKMPFAAVDFIMPVLMILGSVGFMFGSGGSALASKTMGEGGVSAG